MQVVFKDKLTEKMGLDNAIQSLIGNNVTYGYLRYEGDVHSKTALKMVTIAYANTTPLRKLEFEDFKIAGLYTISGTKLYEAGATGFIFGADFQKDFIFAVVQWSEGYIP